MAAAQRLRRRRQRRGATELPPHHILPYTEPPPPLVLSWAELSPPQFCESRTAIWRFCQSPASKDALSFFLKKIEPIQKLNTSSKQPHHSNSNSANAPLPPPPVNAAAHRPHRPSPPRTRHRQWSRRPPSTTIRLIVVFSQPQNIPPLPSPPRSAVHRTIPPQFCHKQN